MSSERSSCLSCWRPWRFIPSADKEEKTQRERACADVVGMGGFRASYKDRCCGDGSLFMDGPNRS